MMINFIFLIYKKERLYELINNIFKMSNCKDCHFGVYNDNPDWLLPTKKIIYNFIEGGMVDIGLNTKEREGTFKARLRAQKKMRFRNVPTIYIDDDDLMISKILEVIGEENPKTLTQYKHIEITDYNEYKRLNKDPIICPSKEDYEKYKPRLNRTIPGNLFNGDVLTDFVDFVWRNYDELITEVFGTPIIHLGEGQLFMDLFNKYIDFNSYPKIEIKNDVTFIFNNCKSRGSVYPPTVFNYGEYQNYFDWFKAKSEITCAKLLELMKEDLINTRLNEMTSTPVETKEVTQEPHEEVPAEDIETPAGSEVNLEIELERQNKIEI